MSRGPAIRLLTLLAALALLAAGGAASAEVDGPTLAVGVDDGEYPELDVALDMADRGAPARLVLYVPQGFDLYPDRPEGSPLGAVLAVAADSFGSESVLAGQIVARQNAPDAAPGCGPGPRLALWELDLSLVGQPLPVPVAVSPAGAGAPSGAGLRLDICPPMLPGADGALLPLRKLALRFDELGPPSAAGRYVWRAVVTPLAPDHRSALEQRTYEVRALVPVPHRLTLRGRYVARSQTAVLTGRLYDGGIPLGGARIHFISLVRRITPKGVRIDDAYAGAVRTSASGAFTFRKRIRRTTGFVAFIDDRIGACTEPTTAPAGCASTTTTGVESNPITVGVASPKR
ncbi:MAG TPA: hypothetical protein VF101_04220 [Gaiellaceae bacterium]